MSDFCILWKGRTLGPVDRNRMPEPLRDKLVPCDSGKKEAKAQAKPEEQPKDEFVDVKRKPFLCIPPSVGRPILEF